MTGKPHFLHHRRGMSYWLQYKLQQAKKRKRISLRKKLQKIKSV
jgi:hypothetical protein